MVVSLLTDYVIASWPL